MCDSNDAAEQRQKRGRKIRKVISEEIAIRAFLLESWCKGFLKRARFLLPSLLLQPETSSTSPVAYAALPSSLASSCFLLLLPSLLLLQQRGLSRSIVAVAMLLLTHSRRLMSVLAEQTGRERERKWNQEDADRGKQRRQRDPFPGFLGSVMSGSRAEERLTHAQACA